VRDKVSHPYKTKQTGRQKILNCMVASIPRSYVLSLCYSHFYRIRQDVRFWTKQEFPKFDMVLFLTRMVYYFACCRWNTLNAWKYARSVTVLRIPHWDEWLGIHLALEGDHPLA
jgi:hypothetical protein